MTLRRLSLLLCVATALAAQAISVNAQTCPAPDEDLAPEVVAERKKRQSEELARLKVEFEQRFAESRKQTDQMADKLVRGATPMEWILGANLMANKRMIELASKAFTNKDDATKAFQEAIGELRNEGKLSETDLLLERAYVAGKRDPAILFALTSHCLNGQSGFCRAHPALADELIAVDGDNAWTWMFKAYGQTGEPAQSSLRKALATKRFNSHLQPQFVVIRELAKDVPVDPNANIMGTLAQLPDTVAIRPTPVFMKACSMVLANGLGAGVDTPPKMQTPAGETCLALMRHIAANSDEERISSMAALMLRMASKAPEDQAPAAEVEARGMAMMNAMAGAFDSQAKNRPPAGALDRILRDALNWTAEHGERESQRRVEAAFKALAAEVSSPAQ